MGQTRDGRASAKRLLTLAGALFLCLTCVQCGDGTPTGPTPPPTTGPPTTGPPTEGPPVVLPPVPAQIFVGAGDIGWCGSPGTPKTGQLADGAGGTVFTAGDNAYMTGTAQEFQNCYAPYWGGFKSRTFPTLGNHEYEGAGPAPYFNYFGANAVNNGPPGLGYYSFELGDAWHAIALNSNIDVSQGSAQGQWLRFDLASSQKKCTVAYWHHPLFTSGPNLDNPKMRDFWRMLYAAGVDIVINGHDHLYERYAPQDPDGRFDPAHGIRQFIVGTGGAQLYNFVTRKTNSEVQISNYGVLKFTLLTDSYQWEFIPVSGQSDFGNDKCH